MSARDAVRAREQARKPQRAPRPEPKPKPKRVRDVFDESVIAHEAALDDYEGPEMEPDDEPDAE
jgi:hypothetical protein